MTTDKIAFIRPLAKKPVSLTTPEEKAIALFGESGCGLVSDDDGRLWLWHHGKLWPTKSAPLDVTGSGTMPDSPITLGSNNAKVSQNAGATISHAP